MKKLIAAAITAATLTACGAEAPKGEWIDGPDGKQVYCITGGQKISCDWEHPR